MSTPQKVYTEREKKIRKRSSEDIIIENKREKVEPIRLSKGNPRSQHYRVISPSSVNIQSETQSQTMSLTTDAIIAAMMSKQVTDHWMNQLNVTIDNKIDTKLRPVNTEIQKMKAENKERDDQMWKLEAKIDEQEMGERRKNIVVEGLKESTKEGIANELNKYLELRIQPTDIAVCYRMIPRRDPQRDTRKYKTKIIFKDQSTKGDVIKAKPKLRGKDHVWINDDLTIYKSGLAYAARAAKREGNVEDTWVFDGQVFIKLIGEERPPENQLAKRHSKQIKQFKCTVQQPRRTKPIILITKFVI